MIVSESGAPEVAVALPIERVVDHHALRRADDAVVGRQELAGQRPGVRIDQPSLRVEALALARDRTGRRPGSGRAGPALRPGTNTLQMSPQRSVSG